MEKGGLTDNEIMKSKTDKKKREERDGLKVCQRDTN